MKKGDLYFVGDYEVYDSGTIITHDDQPIRFLIGSLEFKIVFKKDETIKGYNLSVEQDENNKLSLTFVLTNYNNNFGQGLIKPIEVAVLNKKKLFFQFIVRTLGDTNTKIFEYTWLNEIDVENG